MATIREYHVPINMAKFAGNGNPEQIEPHYDYTNQAWVIGGKYVDCNHPVSMGCHCYGRKHKGELEKK